MERIQRLALYGLIIVAIFIIFNCAGYLGATLIISFSAPQPQPPAAGPPAQVAKVVEFATATPPVTVPPATPLPLLPTVTPAPPEPTLLPTSSPPPATAAAAATATATSIPIVAATAAPGQLEVVSHQSYVDTLGWYHIVGEVRNNANQPMEYVEVMAKLYNESDEIIGTKLTFTAPDIIFPGAVAPFDIIALRQSQWRDIETYRLQLKGDIATDARQQRLVLLSQRSYIEDGLMYVSGEVQNAGNSPAMAKLIVTLYDANKNVVNTGWGYANTGVIAADEVSGFEIKLDHKTDPSNYHYRLQIEEEAIDSDSK